MTTLEETAHRRLAHVNEGRPAVVGRIEAQLRATMPWLPVWVAVATVTLFVTRYGVAEPADAHIDLLLMALLIAGALWALFAVFINHLVLPHLANPRSYADLSARLRQVDVEVARIAHAKGADHERLAELRDELQGLHGDLNSPTPDPGWVSGVSYINLWRRLHRLEESLIPYVPDSELRAVWLHDRLRIEGSRLEKQGSVLPQLIEEAKQKLGSGPLPDSNATPASDKAFFHESIRSLLRSIRTAVNEYRDDQFEAMVNERIGLDRASTLFGFVAWAVLALSIVSQAPGSAVASVAAYYLVGAAAGLVTQLRGTSVSQSSQDIYGYGHAQLRQTMLMSGLAGVVGVFVTYVASHGADATGLVDLTQSLSATPATLLTAILFGLAPGALLDKLSTVAKARINDLESTLATATGEKSA